MSGDFFCCTLHYFASYLCIVQRRIFIFFLFFILCSNVYSQPTLDTIKACLKQKPQLFIKLDSRNSFVQNSRAKIFGAKAGISYGKRLYFGIGYNQLYPPAEAFDTKIYFFDSWGNLYPVTKHLHMYYISVHAEYTFYQTTHWELSMPLQFGIGKSYYDYIYAGAKFRTEESFNFIYEPAVSVEYKFVKWVGVGADVGYRFMITSDKHLNKNFTSPTYAFKLLIYYSEIFKTLFPRSELSKKM
jgi:hypothetical protein